MLQGHLLALASASRAHLYPRGQSSVRQPCRKHHDALYFGLKYVSAALRFTKDHELLKYDDETKIGTISVTDYAQKSLGDVVFVELPAKGTSVAQGGA